MKVQQGSIIFVAVSALKVRAAPGTDQAQTGLLKRGAKLAVIELEQKTRVSGNVWVRVGVVSASGPSVPLGWIAAKYGGKMFVAAKPVPPSVPTSSLPIAPGVTDTIPVAPFIAGGIVLVGVVAFFLLRKK